MIALACTVLAASDCAGCHPAAQRAWEQSRHASAPKNPLYLASFELHGRKPWCQGCHLRPVGCTSCHLPKAGHRARVDARTCAGCHDFDVPQAFGVGPGPLQNTFDEWRASHAAREGKGCGACHDHAARSGHDAAALASALKVLVKRDREGQIVARISAPGAGHAVPTGDPFRRLMLWAGGERKPVRVPADQTVELKLGAGAGSTWRLTYLHAEIGLEAWEHAVEVTGGNIE